MTTRQAIEMKCKYCGRKRVKMKKMKCNYCGGIVWFVFHLTVGAVFGRARFQCVGCGKVKRIK